MKRGVTLIEFLVCLAIIAVVAAIVAPVYSHARHSAKTAGATEQLRQLHSIVMDYRQDYDFVAHGSATAMGLPEVGSEVGRPMLWWLPTSLWNSTCGIHPDFRQAAYARFHVWYSDLWEPHVLDAGESALFMIDPNCTDHGKKLNNDYRIHFGLATRLDGSVWRRTARGIPDDFNFWGYDSRTGKRKTK